MESTSNNYERNCVLCCQEFEIFALGKCDHPVCYRCSTKMRVLCDQKYCAVCREELDKVVFVQQLVAFSSLPLQQLQVERKHDIYFTDAKIYTQFRRLLLSECPVCPETKVFSKFEELEQHMRKQHELFCCKLCSKHLQIFSHERKWYNRKDLVRHRTQGDPDDTSHRGHPLCKFCDDRYLDNDELLKHLRRDHYFCHFCDADGAQEYYSDYQYLSEHFREAHYLCEEGRCATEQFTHAFRTDIDYKAHKASAHSKNRAEARQNRHIDLQFTYAPRQARRNDVGMVTGEDYEEVRSGRGGRGRSHGGQQNSRGSWRYHRAIQAPITNPFSKSLGSFPVNCLIVSCRSTVLKHLLVPPLFYSGFSFNLSPVCVCSVCYSVMPPPAPKTQTALKEDDFPSLSAAMLTSPMTPAYSGQPRKNSSFQEEDFPALVSKIRPSRPVGGAISAWSQASCSNSKTVTLPSSSRPPPNNPPLPLPSGLQPLSSSSSSSRRKKPAARRPSPPSDDDYGDAKTMQEHRSVPTMLDISSLLTASKPSPATAKKKKPQQITTPSSLSGNPVPVPVETVSRVQKENVPESHVPKPPVTMTTSAVKTVGKASSLANGHLDKPVTTTPLPNAQSDLPLDLEEFPALITKKPPPGFKSSAPSSLLLPPPPGLGIAAPPPSKPPPGFTGIPLNSNVVDLPQSPGVYLVPENFHQRNKELIQSIRNLLQNDETRFNQFKEYSVQFRQGLMSAPLYHLSCKDLLGENFIRIFNELLVLLPDTGKQQELLTAHADFRSMEKQGGAGGGRARKSKKSAWQTPSTANAAELDCQVCPTCCQVLDPKDFNSHKTLHLGENEDFPSLQAVSRIIS
uniref:RING-type E3 ubiquitin transferase n=1 Tax=Esox lucius TaxID=8010 RepID=A0A3P8Y877_ESOLU